jgi:hypothetical protein
VIFENTEVETLFKIMHDNDLRKLWDQNTLEFKVLEKVNDNMDVIYQKYQTPRGISNRDSLVLRQVKKIGETYFILCKSIVSIQY